MDADLKTNAGMESQPVLPIRSLHNFIYSETRANNKGTYKVPSAAIPQCQKTRHETPRDTKDAVPSAAISNSLRRADT